MTAKIMKRRTLLWTSVVLAPLLIFFGLLLAFPLVNLFSGIRSLLLEKEPPKAELIGRYNYSAAWGRATFDLDPDGAFNETIVEKNASSKRINGSWTSSKDGNSAKVDFRPFVMVWDEDHGRKINLFGMNFYKRRFGNTYAIVDNDLGEQFERQ